MISNVRQYVRRVKRRKLLFVCLICLIVMYAVTVTLLGAGDSRTVDPAAISFGSASILFLLIYLIVKITGISRMLQRHDYNEIKSRMISEEDEYRLWLYEKSGGSVFLCSLVAAVLVTVTCSLFNTKAFLASFVVAFSMVLLKTGFYIYFRYFSGDKTEYE